ncbi:MAG: hypothetical protein QM714_08640 [Nocardioides sp.]|uniref:hypothetical protein n=1 Tax=Nocardioides sp. TaxID=35761 RepID=UPI0039E52153
MNSSVATSARADDAVRPLAPGYFALVMATGIVSVAMNNADQPVLSGLLLAIALAAYVVLVVL